MRELNILSVREYVRAIGNPELMVKTSVAFALKEVAGSSVFERIRSIEVLMGEEAATCIVRISTKKAHAIVNAKKERIENLAAQISQKNVSVEVILER